MGADLRLQAAWSHEAPNSRLNAGKSSSAIVIENHEAAVVIEFWPPRTNVFERSVVCVQAVDEDDVQRIVQKARRSIYRLCVQQVVPTTKMFVKVVRHTQRPRLRKLVLRDILASNHIYQVVGGDVAGIVAAEKGIHHEMFDGRWQPLHDSLGCATVHGANFGNAHRSHGR